MLKKCIAAALAVGIAAAATSTAQAHHHARRHYVALWPATLPYSYAYDPILGFSRYGNCYLVEQFTSGTPYLVRVCPPR